MPRFSLHAGNVVWFGILIRWTAVQLCILISRTSCPIQPMDVYGDSGIVYMLSHISWCLLKIAAIVSYSVIVQPPLEMSLTTGIY